MRAIILATLLAATPTLAQPAPQPAPAPAPAPALAPAIPAPGCSIDVLRAPDAAREIIEQWISRATSCSVALEVRVVPTEGGLYVVANDDRGRTRERIVPDARRADRQLGG